MSRLRAYDVVPYLKTGTIVVGVNFRSVLLVTEDHELVNMHNGRKAEAYEWYTANSEVEIFENFEDWTCADSPMEIDKDVDDLIKEIGPQTTEGEEEEAERRVNESYKVGYLRGKQDEQKRIQEVTKSQRN